MRVESVANISFSPAMQEKNRLWVSYLYAIVCRFTGTPIYIGGTADSPLRHFRGMWAERTSRRIASYLRSMRGISKAPAVALLRIVPASELGDAERALYWDLVEQGYELLNEASHLGIGFGGAYYEAPRTGRSVDRRAISAADAAWKQHVISELKGRNPLQLDEQWLLKYTSHAIGQSVGSGLVVPKRRLECAKDHLFAGGAQ